MNKVMCPYCDKAAKLIDGSVIYPHRMDLKALKFYMCENGHDRAYVGCHKGTIKPLGTLANANLRTNRSNAHAVFDTIWRDGYLSRSDAYSMLAKELGIEKKDCHIGMFNAVQCVKTQKIAIAHLSGLSD